MAPLRDDQQLRMIRLAFQAVQRLRERMLDGPGEAEAVLREARDAQAGLLGPLAGAVAVLDADTAVGLLRDRERLETWAELLRVEAEAHQARGDAAAGEAAERRAGAILDACGRLLG